MLFSRGDRKPGGQSAGPHGGGAAHRARTSLQMLSGAASWLSSWQAEGRVGTSSGAKWTYSQARTSRVEVGVLGEADSQDHEAQVKKSEACAGAFSAGGMIHFA